MTLPTDAADLFAAEADRHRAEATFHREQGERHQQLADRYAALASQSTLGIESLHAQFWALPAETRLTAQQVAEASGRTTAWVYKHIDARRTDLPLPYRREGGGSRDRLVFLAGEVREWMRQREIVIRPRAAAPVGRHLSRI